jgi:signal transduction histidine kinase
MSKTFFNSMTGRIFLLLVGGTIISGALVMALADYERKDLAMQLRAHHAAERVGQIILTLDATPPALRQDIVSIAEKYGVRLDLSHSTALIGEAPDTGFAELLRRELGESRVITAFQRQDLECPVKLDGQETVSPGPHHCETVFVTLKDGTPIQLDVAHHDRPPPFQNQFLLDLFLFLAGISVLALIVSHMASKPLRKLAQAARDFGSNIDHPSLPENEGPNEVREASSAFNGMQVSIRHYVQERAYMLAAIAHDLQTPLTRLRLRLEKVTDEELRNKLLADLSATQEMVKEGLEFVRSANNEEPMQQIDLDSMIEAICDDATDAGLEVSLSGKIGVPIMAHPSSLRRCISNLVDNAVKYGNFAHITIKREGAKVVISIIDGGSGIPKDQLEKVFQPFNRLENSRSRDSGGTGLGLTIARNIAEKHRGTIKLRNVGAADLGLEATLEFVIP